MQAPLGVTRVARGRIARTFVASGGLFFFTVETHTQTTSIPHSYDNPSSREILEIRPITERNSVNVRKYEFVENTNRIMPRVEGSVVTWRFY